MQKHWRTHLHERLWNRSIANRSEEHQTNMVSNGHLLSSQRTNTEGFNVHHHAVCLVWQVQATLPQVQATLPLVQASLPQVQATLPQVQATLPLVQASLREVHSLFQSQFSLVGDLVLPLSVSIAFLFPRSCLLPIPRLPFTSSFRISFNNVF